ncbi:MAG: hypothetical protein WCW84_07855 [Sulfurimonas sp.]|jgi:hypothetical protein
MFDIIMAVTFTFTIVAIMAYAFKPVWDTMKRDELEREEKKRKSNTQTVHPA